MKGDKVIDMGYSLLLMYVGYVHILMDLVKKEQRVRTQYTDNIQKRKTQMHNNRTHFMENHAQFKIYHSIMFTARKKALKVEMYLCY